MPYRAGEFGVVCGLIFMLSAGGVSAAEWSFLPSLNVEQTRTDNLTLQPEGQELSESITQVNPGFVVSGAGPRLSLDSRYNMQNLSYSSDSSADRTDNQFSLALGSELIADWLYLDLNGQLSQQLLAPQNGISQDNLSPDNGSRGDVVTSRISPMLRRQFASGVELEFGLSAARVNYEFAGLNDSSSGDVSFSVMKPAKDSGLDWGLSVSDNRIERNNASDYETLSIDGHAGLAVSRTVKAVAYTGREESEFDTSRDIKDGDYWSVGLHWQPSSRFSLELTQGDNDAQIHLALTPGKRSQLFLSYVERDVGANTGTTWIVNASHQTRRSVWSLSYTENISSDAILVTSELDYDLLAYDVQMQGGEVFFDAQGVPVPVLAELGDEEFIRTVASASVSYSTGKSQIKLRLSDEQRDYELSARYSESQSALLSLNWKFASRTFIDVAYRVMATDELNVGETESVVGDVSLNRNVGKKAMIKLAWRQTDMSQDQLNNSYLENRISASLSIKF